MPTAESLARRLSSLLRRYGQTVTITHGGVATALRCRVTPLSFAVRVTHFLRAETDAWDAPAYQLTVPGDYAALTVGDAVTLPGGGPGYTVRGWDRTRLGDGVVRTLVFVARDAVAPP